MSTLVDRLAELIADDNAVLFVGANLPQGADRPSLVQQIADALAMRIAYDRPSRDLAAVARDFEVLHGRNALVLAVREALEKVAHTEPAAAYQLIADAVLPSTKIITTRFDKALERALDQFEKPYVLIVRETDLPFFDEAKVTVIKIQGDIGQPDSLVVTEDDIDAFIDELPTVSDVVRAFFATKTLVFLGYDLNGEHFKRLFRQVTRNLSAFRRPAFAIVAKAMDEIELEYWRSHQVTIHVEQPVPFLDRLAVAVRSAVERSIPDREAHKGVPELSLPERPYKGLDAYSSADRAVFVGRNQESHRLLNRILAHRITILYGESGSGKTSLLRAGVEPLLAEHRALMAVCVPKDRQLDVLLREALAASGQSRNLPAAGDAVEDMIRQWQRVLDGPIVLAIDQFERFFLRYELKEQVQAARLLHSLFSDRSLDVRLILVIREDFVGRLQGMEAHVPGLLDVRFRLERLGRETARAAIEEPARLFGKSWQPDLVETLLDELEDEANGGLAPPQLQIVCQALYDRAAAQSQDEIRLADLEALGRSEGILGSYLDQVLNSFAPDEQRRVRHLLGVLVSTRGVRQRLALEDLVRAAEMQRDNALAVLRQLVERRLVRRYDATGRDGSESEYELAHDYLAARIARWLGDDFWAVQKLREILRQAVPAWRERDRLMGIEDLRAVIAQQGRMRFSDAEKRLVSASTIGHGEPGWACEDHLSRSDCKAVIDRLCQWPDAAVRRQAVIALSTLIDGEAEAERLARFAWSDPDPGVRKAAAAGIVRLCSSAQAHASAAAHVLDQIAREPEHADRAKEALVSIRDAEPAAEAMISDPLRGEIRRRVWRARWRRHQPRLLTRTVQGVRDGFWGLGLGLGLFLGLSDVAAAGFDRISWVAAIQLMSLGIPLAGLLGAMTAGVAVFVREARRALADDDRPWHVWGMAAAAAGVAGGLGFVLLSYVLAGAARPGRAFAGGALIGAGLVGMAMAPVKIANWGRLILVVLGGIALFFLASRLGLIFVQRAFWWPIVIGGTSGLGFALAAGLRGKE
jgi:type II secretory pathway predicted ATPase ExeA